MNLERGGRHDRESDARRAGDLEKILQRRRLNQPRIPSEKMQVFKAKLGEEIERAGSLSQEFVDQLMEQLRNGEL